MSKKRFEEIEPIERMQIPDDDAYNWMKTLEEAGFSLDEIDRIMTHLNKTWRLSKKKQLMLEKFEKISAGLKKLYGVVLDPARKDALIRQIEEEFEE